MANENYTPSTNFAQGHTVGGVSSAETGDQLALRVDPTTKRLLVTATISAFTGVTDGEAVDAADTGSLILGTDGTNYQILKTDSDGNLQVDIVSGTIVLDASDLQIGAVEIKNSSDDTRATVGANGLYVELRASNVDVMLGTDFSDVFGTGSLLIATQADNVANTQDSIATSAFLYGFDGSTWDRLLVGGGTEAAALRVTVASDSTGVLSIDDNGGIITVDGTVAVTIAQDVMLGTDFSDVLGTASLILATQADDLVNTSDGLQTTSFLYGFDGTTWDRLRGTATDGLLVNLGANNDISGTVTANLSATDNAVLDNIDADTTTIIGHVDGIEGLLTTIDADTSILSGLVLATQADDVVNTADGLQTTNFNMVFDGTTWDRLRGDSTNGALVNLGANNDVTVTGTVDLGATDNAVLDAIAASVAAIDTDATTIIGHVDGIEGILTTIDADTGGILTAIQIMDDWDNGASDGASVSGDVAHDTADAGEPVKLGMKAVALKANPTEVAANDRTNWYADVSGVPFVLPGHPNILSQSLQVTDADGAQTDTAIITAAANVAVVVTKVSVVADNANTGDVSCRIGFGTANTPAADAAQVLMFHPGIAPGSGVIEGAGSGIIGIGASNEDVRVTCEDPAGGSINIIITYFTTEIA